ncbi:MAG: type II toxin-antitoxin system Phd/YefM family antitoxin [Verrucomicrobia bacterium]|nr:type II toxin-antitoxin system Phd/YefM family antitoxin [Verrucomicrobiota bacterium]MDA1087413.1 type II toxin-antitoxin system Phd/YefM family antitoxin [Verrucomicrobiota bacterium]
MKRISTYEAKAKLSKLIALVEKSGEPITICRNNKPIVDLVVHREPSDPLLQDPELRGAIYHGDPVAPVSEEDWPQELR